jgi:hypothetical protein
LAGKTEWLMRTPNRSQESKIEARLAAPHRRFTTDLPEL